MGRSVLACFTLTFFLSPEILHAEPSGEVSFLSLQTRIQEVFSTSVSSVVRVKAARERRVGNKVSTSLKMGSGFFISKEGHVLTTGLLQDADRIWIEHHNSFYLAEKVGHDPLCNLSLLKVTVKPKNFSFTSFAETKGDLSVGAILIGITCALEFKIAPTYGIMQSYEFSFGKRLFPTKMIRSSMALGMGEIGAPVFDLNGRFVGITYAALPDLRSSFLLPARACQRIRDDLLLSGKVNYGWFGITTIRKANADSGLDIVISDFIEGSPASDSKLKKGDILRKINGSIVYDSGDLAHVSFFSKPGTFAQFTVYRQGKEFMIPVKVGARQTDDSNKLLDMNNTPRIYSLDTNDTTESAPKTIDLNKTALP
jgi:S1-C subfamily serine protease